MLTVDKYSKYYEEWKEKLMKKKELFLEKLKETFDKKDEWFLNPTEEKYKFTHKKTIQGAELSTRTTKMDKYKMVRCVVKFKSSKTPREYIDFVEKIQGGAEISKENKEIYKKVDPGNIFYSNFIDEKIDDDNSWNICHVKQASGNFLIWNRDFLIVRKIQHEENKSYIYGQSIDTVKEKISPLDKKSVRGYSRFFLQAEKNGDEITVTNFIHADPAGWILPFVYNLAVFSKVYEVLRFVKEFQGEDIPDLNKDLSNESKDK